MIHSGPAHQTYLANLPPPMRRPARILFIFLDGVGIGLPDGSSNPLARLERGFFPLFLDPSDVRRVGLFGLSPRLLHPLAASGHHAALDAGLGVPGTPQSATGQATLFTGENAARFIGHHLMAFPTPALAALVRKENLLRKAERAGKSAAFLNAYTPRFHELGYPHSVSTVCALSLSHPLQMLDEMHAGHALFHDLSQEGLRKYYGEGIPVFEPFDAGERLAGAASRWELSLFEHFLTDRIGHRADMARGFAQISMVERFLEGVLANTDLDEMLVVVCTDHGNLEDARTKGHTRNPVALSAWGRGADWLTQTCRSLLDVTPQLLRLLLGTHPEEAEALAPSGRA